MNIVQDEEPVLDLNQKDDECSNEAKVYNMLLSMSNIIIK